MSRLSEYRSLEQQITLYQQQLESLEDDPGLKAEIELEAKLHSLLDKYGKQLSDVVSMLDRAVGRTDTRAAQSLVRRARQVKVYRNPLTGEIVESKGGNNKLLGAWKAQFGHDEVESWVKQS